MTTDAGSRFPTWMTGSTEGVLIRLYIQPKASRSEVSGEHGEGADARLKIRVAAPPVDGEANEELVRFLKKMTSVPTSRIRIVRGASSRSKDVFFDGAVLEDLARLVLVREKG